MTIDAFIFGLLISIVSIIWSSFMALVTADLLGHYRLVIEGKYMLHHKANLSVRGAVGQMGLKHKCLPEQRENYREK